MLALKIVLCVLLFILFLLFLPVRLFVTYEEDLTVQLRVLGLRFPLYPKEKKVRLSKYSKRKMRKRRRKRPVPVQTESSDMKKKKTSEQSLRTVRIILYILKNSHARLFSAFRVRNCRLRASVATGDAARTAILYGVVCQSVSYLLEALGTLTGTRVDGEEVTVFADFCGEKTELSLHILLSTNLFRALRLALAAGTSFLKVNKTEKAKNQNGGIQNERKQSK